MTITSTRSNKSVDARRDFDGFNVDKELDLMREAMWQGEWRKAAELASNLDEHLSRGGSLPVAWLGPSCMQTDPDLEERHARTITRARALLPQERVNATGNYVAVPPET